MKLANQRLSRRHMLQGSGSALLALGLAGATGFITPPQTQASEEEERVLEASKKGKPTVVLIHGAFAESSSWDDVISTLATEGYAVVALGNPLRGVSYDTDYTLATLATLPGPLVLVGHSYGGMVISGAASANTRVKALVFVAAFAPEAGESAADLSGRFPGSSLGPTLAPPVPLADGSNDLYIQQEKYRAQFCADLPEPQARRMAATQRPCTDLALNEKASSEAAWKRVPSWFVWGELDKNIPAAAHRFMAERADAREAIEVKGASHVVGISSADTVAQVILKAAKSVK